MPTPRFFIPDTRLASAQQLELPPNASRHVQVLRLQPGAELTLFDGHGGQWQAQVLAIGRRSVSAQVLQHQARECELATPVALALGMPANERMDTLIEKATELGAAHVQPLVCERSVLRVAGERAERKAAHWQAIAASACEQSGRNRVPSVAPPLPLRDWLSRWSTPPQALGASFAIPSSATSAAAAGSVPTAAPTPAPTPAPAGLLLSLADDAIALGRWLRQAPPGTACDAAPCRWVQLLSGPEGGLSPGEEAAARAAGLQPVSLGARVLRADTAPLAALALLAALADLPG